ncbi:MAG: carotenoid biosynthesis protein [Spirochaetales bacterium]|nr:carotenoid biosynthesis protein [Spirochaetales bacterium]
MGEKNNKLLQTVLWVSIAIIIVASLLDLAFRGAVQTIAPAVTVIMFLVFSFIHGSMNFGFKNMVVFFLVTFIISWGYETLSILTGFPFGHYFYTELLGLKLWLVPLVIMPAYFGVLYCSWIITHIFLDKYSMKIKGMDIFGIPFIASFLMVMWDLVFDPYASTIRKYWTWQEGGAYFGVPFSNYMGWFLCVFTILILFALYLRLKEKRTPSHGDYIQNRANFYQPIIFYGVVGLRLFINPFVEKSETIQALNNHTWVTGDIMTATALVGLFTMVFVIVLAVVKLNRHFR